MEEKYDGMYLIRGSNNVESEKVFVQDSVTVGDIYPPLQVLSVWTNGKSRHYKVFCDPVSVFCYHDVFTYVSISVVGNAALFTHQWGFVCEHLHSTYTLPLQ